MFNYRIDASAPKRTESAAVDASEAEGSPEGRATGASRPGESAGQEEETPPGRPCRVFPRGARGLLQLLTPRVRVSPAARTLLPLGPCVAEAARPPPPRGRRASSPGTGELCAISDGPRQLRSRIRVASSWPARFPHRTPLSLAASPRAPLMKSLSRGPPPQTLLQGCLA